MRPFDVSPPITADKKVVPNVNTAKDAALPRPKTEKATSTLPVVATIKTTKAAVTAALNALAIDSPCS